MPAKRTKASFRFYLPLLAAAVLIPFEQSRAQSTIVPPGFPKGPFIDQNMRSAKKGELLVTLSSRTKSKLTNIFKKKNKGRSPSPYQLQSLLAKQLGLRVSDSINAETVLLKGKRVNSAKVKRAESNGLVRRAQSNYSVFAFDSTNDFFYTLGLLWNLHSSGGFLSSEDIDVDAPEAWQITTGSSSLVVAVVDTGLFYGHRDIADNLWINPREEANGLDDDGNGYIDDFNGWDFVNEDNDPDDDQFHGTHVAGTIAAVRNNGYGIAGVAPNVKILPLKVLGSDGSGDTAGLVRAIDYAVLLKQSGVNVAVINASLGGGDRLDALENAIRRADKAGIVFVAAAGNDGSDNDTSPVYPAGYDLANVISVAALTGHGALADFSNYGARSVHVAAPGDGIWSSIILNFYLPFSGTSMAAPHVAGIAALLKSRNPSMSPSTVKSRIMNSVKPLSGLEGKMRAPGIVSAYRALR